MRTVNGNWGAVVKEMRKIIAEHTFFKSQSFTEHFNTVLYQTDSFHPFGSEAEHLMSRVINNMPVRCDYRSCDALHEWQWYRGNMRDAIWAWLDEVQYAITEYYNEPWNFAPGYVPPAPIEFSDWDKVSSKVFARVHRAAMAK